MKKNRKVVTKKLRDGQILKVRLQPYLKTKQFTIFNVSTAVSASHRQLNDWDRKKKNKRARKLSMKLTGTMAIGVNLETIRIVRQFYKDLKPGDSLCFRCESCAPEKQYRAYKKWLLEKEKDPWEALPDVKGFFIYKRGKKKTKSLYQEVCS